MNLMEGRSCKYTEHYATHGDANVCRIGQLEIFKDTILGYGSGGTTVYEGSFEVSMLMWLWVYSLTA